MNLKYKHDEEVHNLTSPEEVVPVIMEMFNPSSVLDVGCGIGTWMHVFSNHGVLKIAGIDGDYVDRTLLSKHIDLNFFHEKDLTEPFDLQTKFDLVISLEVAEHLPETSAEGFVESLTRHSDIVVFSAAIPGQGGQNHINEQDYAYWIEKFKRHGYRCSDALRPRIWNNPKISYWYKQNILCFTKGSAHSIEESPILQTTHPDVLRMQLEQEESNHDHVISGKSGILNSLRIFIKSILHKFG